MPKLRQAEIVLEVACKSKERPRFSGHAYKAEAYRQWLEQTRALMSEWWIRPPLEKVRMVHVHFFGPAVGDVDNKLGAVLDAGNGVIWRDDNVKIIPCAVPRWTKAPRKEQRIYLKVVWTEE